MGGGEKAEEVDGVRETVGVQEREVIKVPTLSGQNREKWKSRKVQIEKSKNLDFHFSRFSLFSISRFLIFGEGGRVWRGVPDIPPPLKVRN